MNQPLPPAHLLQQIANDPSPEHFVSSFEHLGQIVSATLAQAGCELAGFESVLDLGCGLGRLLFALRPLLGPNQRLRGCDVNLDCARWCQQNIDFAAVAHTSIRPPLPYSEREFDLVSAISVFTHLDLDKQFEWAREAYRILRPGGVLFVTFHGPFFFPAFFSLPTATDEDQRGIASRARAALRPLVYSWRQAKRARLLNVGAEGLFGYIGTSDDAGQQGQRRVAAAHSRPLVLEQFAAFEPLLHVPQSALALGQDVYVFRKPADGHPVATPRSGESVWTRPPGAPLSLRLHLDGQRAFRVLASAEPAGSYALEHSIEVRAGETLLSSETLEHSASGRVAGPNHVAVLRADLAEHKGEATVTLRSQLRSGVLPPNTSVTWRQASAFTPVVSHAR